jgi:hypothetical protein
VANADMFLIERSGCVIAQIRQLEAGGLCCVFAYVETESAKRMGQDPGKTCLLSRRVNWQLFRVHQGLAIDRKAG